MTTEDPVLPPGFGEMPDSETGLKLVLVNANDWRALHAEVARLTREREELRAQVGTFVEIEGVRYGPANFPAMEERYRTAEGQRDEAIGLLRRWIFSSPTSAARVHVVHNIKEFLSRPDIAALRLHLKG